MSELRAELERLLGKEAVGAIAVGGRTLPVATPASEDALCEILRFAARAQHAVVPVGFGSKLGWCAPPTRCDFAISTRALTGVVAYEPRDGTLAARAGTAIDAIARAVDAGGNHLSPLVPNPSRATLGGVLAASQSGVDRLRFGPARHQVLGMRVALGDGTLAKSGGRLVKNVTGFDLHRLYCGSHGTLCVIVEAALRVHPKPDSSVVLSASTLALDDALAAVRRIAQTPVQPWAVRIESSSSAFDLHVVLAGGRETVEWELAQILGIVPRAAAAPDPVAALARLRDLELAGGGPHVQIAARPSRAQALIAQAVAASTHARVVADPLIATIDAFFGRTAPEVVLALVRRLRSAGETVALRDAPAGVLRTIDPFGEPAAPLTRMRRIQRALDPQGVFACGRFHGGL